MDDIRHGLFKWCTTQKSFGGPSCDIKAGLELGEQPRSLCEWCESPLIADNESKTFFFSSGSIGYPNVTENQDLTQCTVCGWYLLNRGKYSHQVHINYERTLEIAVLKEYHINDEDNITLSELGTYLKHNFSDVYTIGWRRFEELVEDMFKNLGYRTELTQKTCDDGVDIIILNSDGNKQAIIEVKKYAKEKKVGVELVRQLIGSQYLHGVDKSYLVTSSSFTKAALDAYKKFNATGDRLEMELWDCARLLDVLGLYNAPILPINQLKRGVPLREQILKYKVTKRVIVFESR
jgi:hypothetical protein